MNLKSRDLISNPFITEDTGLEMRKTSFIEAMKILSKVVVDDYRRECYIIQYKQWINNIRELTLHIERTSK